MIKPQNFYAWGLAILFAFSFTACDDDDEGTLSDNENGNGNGAEVQTGTVTDKDGNVYQTRVIGDLEWMTENLNTETSMGLSYCYDEATENCETYGKLYDFEAITQGQEPSSGRIQGICPNGWFLPRRQDTYDVSVWNSNQPNDLKADSELWFGSGRGNNETGFSALPGGSFRILIDDNDSSETLEFSDLSQGAFIWWLGDIEDAETFYGGNISIPAAGTQVGHTSRTNEDEFLLRVGYSCRCVKPL